MDTVHDDRRLVVSHLALRSYFFVLSRTACAPDVDAGKDFYFHAVMAPLMYELLSYLYSVTCHKQRYGVYLSTVTTSRHTAGVFSLALDNFWEKTGGYVINGTLLRFVFGLKHGLVIVF